MSSDLAAPPEGVTPFVCEMEVRFADIDGMQHVNNAKYLTYTENARTAWAGKRLQPGSLFDITFILARAEIDFRAPASLGDTVRVIMWTSHVGSKSWTFDYRLENAASGAVLANARTVQVAFDYGTQTSMKIEGRLREAILAHGPA